MRIRKTAIPPIFLVLFFCAHAEDVSKKFVVAKPEQEIIDATNAERKKENLPLLKPNALLFAAARKHAADMAKEGKMEHELYGKTHGDRITAAGYKPLSGRENIAFDYKNARDVVDGWMNSEGHKANILADDITEIGVGIVNDKDGKPYYCQVFARPTTDVVTVRFSLRNTTKKTITIDLGGSKPETVKPGENPSYSIFGPSPAPSITVECDGNKQEVKVRSGEKLIAQIKDGALDVQTTK